MNINKIENLNSIVCGDRYSGEVLIVDFGMGGMGIDENKEYVICNDGEVVEVI